MEMGDLPEDAPRTPDHPELCLAWERGVNLWAETAYHRLNSDEALAGNYTLPPLPETKAEWEKQRPEILQSFKDCMYGVMPPPPDFLELKLLAENDSAMGGIAIRREYRLCCRMDSGRCFDFDMMLYVPKSVPKPPVFSMLNFQGNQTGPDPDIRPTRAPGDTPGRWHTDAVNPQKRNTADSAPNMVEFVKNGYALATACYGEIFPDNLDGFRKSIYRLFYDDLRPDCEVSLQEIQAGHRRNYGAIGAWAWGYSRIADALEKIDLIDSTKLAIVGHSRLGKTALWAGANDPRFALVCSNNSGHGGATLSRRNFGENLSMLWMVKSDWFCDRMVQYAGRAETLPVDQHQLLALIAPRALCVASSSRDIVADFKGEFLAAKEASKIWEHYGFKGLQTPEMPPENTLIGDGIHYFIKTGPHSMTPYDVDQYCAIADRMWKI